ncbi:MAG: hypothetical protein IKD28_00245 [Clostridia bacterium]|nr:hypothetical protein [Clostridia bacterium]
MSAGILGLFGVCVAAGMGEMLLPGDEKGGTRRFLRILVALALLLLLARPMLLLLGGGEGWLGGDWGADAEGGEQNFEEILGEAVAKRSAEDLCAGLHAFLESEFDIAAEDAEIAVSLEKGGELRRVAVYLSGKALLVDPDEIEQAIVRLLGCEVEVR